MPVEKSVKISKKLHKQLQQYKLDHECKSLDQAIEQLLKR